MKINTQARTLGGLTCRMVDALPEGTPPRVIVIFCHGFGAPGTDLVPFAAELLEFDERLAQSARFLFPAAPLSLDLSGIPGGRAWWQLDMMKLNAAMISGEFRDLRNEYPQGLTEAREKLTALMTEVHQETGLPMSRWVLGGFSQGAMLALDTALRLPDSPGAVCLFSGTLLCEEQWRELAARRGPLRVVLSHGRYDQILPFQAAVWVRDLLTEAGMDVEFLPFNGPHTIPPEALVRAAALIADIAEREDGKT